MYAELIKDNNLTPDRIFNLDESGLATDVRTEQVFVSKKDRNAYLRAASCGKATYSVLFCASASGVFMPPFTVYKGLHLYESWTNGGPAGAVYGVTKSGWMEGSVFEGWFSKVFLPHVKDMTKPVLIIYDGHGSHLTYDTVYEAMENEVIILCLPPNTSQALQPLDVGLFKPLRPSGDRS
ncbi:Jerky -like [Amphibalanus amphitrite]|uniref:Jerky-like n=1 Tax=Amphibalanus amphitrite TaxID=1232801 RepID=A0A6A4WNY8_AMPAM|nr:Jerky -like [Amphibalanus amphitrite]